MKINFEGSLEEFQSLFRGAPLPQFHPSEFSTSAEDDWEEPGQSTGMGPFTMPVPDREPLPKDGLKGVDSQALPVPDNDPWVGKKLNLPPIRPEQRVAAWAHFVDFCSGWVEGFEETREVAAPEVRAVDEEGEHLLDDEGNAVMAAALDEDGSPLTVTEPVDQPDRLSMMQEIGQGRWPIPLLVMAYEENGHRSLQRMVEAALVERQHDQRWAAKYIAEYAADPESAEEHEEAWLDFVDRVAATMVQVSHMGFPDLAGTYDYSTRWRRS